MPIRIALYQPDIPQNTGTILRTAACFGVGVDIIEPAGFDLSDRALKRAGLDYLKDVAMKRHPSWDAFQAITVNEGLRIILLSSKADTSHTEFEFRENDVLLMGRESSGVPDDVHNLAHARVRIAICEGMRSLNLAVATGIATAEALRQTGGFPKQICA